MSRDMHIFDFSNSGMKRALLAVVLAAGCGVQGHQQGNAVDPNADHSSDFGPSTSTPPTAGAAGSAQIAAQSGAGATAAAGFGAAAGIGVGVAAAGSGAGTGTPPTMMVATAGAPATTPPAAAGSGGAAPPSTMPAMSMTTDLGGTPVAKEDLIAFIHIGHSNMAGRAYSPMSDRPYYFTDTDPHAWMYHVGSMPELAHEPNTAGDDLSGFYGGPGTALLKQAVQMAPNKYFMSLGFGKASAYCSQFLPGALYYDSLIAAPKSIKDRVTFGAIVIMLGITERHGTMADITGFSDCINKLVTAIRNDVGRPDLPMLISDYEQNATGDLAVTGSFAQMIIPEIHKIPMVVSNSAIVPTDGLTMQDDHHFDFEGHKVWTKRVLDIMKQKGWAPWAQ